MEINHLRQQLTQVDQIIHRAEKAIDDDKAAPQELKDYMHQLGTQSRQAQQKMKQAKDGTAMVQYVDDLEKTSDRAKKASENAPSLGASAKQAVQTAYLQVSSLKQQLH